MTLTEKQKAWDKAKAATRADRASRRHGEGSTTGRVARRRQRFGHGLEKLTRSRIQRRGAAR